MPLYSVCRVLSLKFHKGYLRKIPLENLLTDERGVDGKCELTARAFRSSIVEEPLLS